MEVQIVCTYCSATKDDSIELLPANKRYMSKRISYVKDLALLSGIDFYILSGKFGLVHENELLPYYDHLLSLDEVSSLSEIVAEQIVSHRITTIDFFIRASDVDPNVKVYIESLKLACGKNGTTLNIYILGELKQNHIIYEADNVKLLHQSVIDTQLVYGSVDLAITSPPYNLDIKYNSYDDTRSYEEYFDFNRRWMTLVYNWLKVDGRFCINIPLDKNRNGREPVTADITQLAKEVGFKYHSTVIWQKNNISNRTAWGSWMSASAPSVLAPVETIIILYKGVWKKTSGSRISTIKRDDFIKWTSGLWNMSPAKKSKIGHPAPFPLELPHRCINLFSYKNDVVLDPFAGSGTTLVSALLNERRGIGIEIDKSYTDTAIDRIKRLV